MSKNKVFHIIVFSLFFSFSFAQTKSSEAYNEVFMKMAEANNYFYSNLDTFNNIYEKAYKNFRKDYFYKVTPQERKELSARYYNARAAFLQANGLVQESINNMDSAIYYSSEIQNNDLRASFYDNYGVILQDAGQVFNAIKNHEKAIEIRTNIKDSLGLAFSYNNIGFVYYKQKLKERALDYFYQSIQFYKSQNDFGEVLPRQNVADIYRELNDLEQYYQNIDRINILAIENGNELYQNLYFSKLGYYYFAIGELDTAAVLLSKSEKYFEKVKNHKKLALIYSDLARLYIQKKDKQKALRYALYAKKSTELIDLRATKVTVYKLLYEIYADLNMNENALRYLSAHYSLKDSIENEDFYRDRLYQLNEIKFKAEKDSIRVVYNSEMKIAVEKLESEERLRYLIIISTVAGLLLALLVILNIRLKQKYVKENYEKELLLNQHLSNELEVKTKKLVNSSLKTLQDQKVIEEIESLIAEISLLESEDLSEKVQKVKSEIKNNKLSTKKLDNYQSIVTTENEAFTTSLKTKYPKLTPKELKLCVLLKMNYSSDEICQILGVASTTLKNARYRIHKKIGLEKGVRLQEYLIQLA